MPGPMGAGLPDKRCLQHRVHVHADVAAAGVGAVAVDRREARQREFELVRRGVSGQHFLARRLSALIDPRAAVAPRLFVNRHRRIAQIVNALAAGMDQSAHSGEPHRLGNVQCPNQVHLKTEVRRPIALQPGGVNHHLGARVLHRLDQRRQLPNIAANHRQLPSKNFAQIIQVGLQVEKRHLIAALRQLLGRVAADQTTSGNQDSHDSPLIKIPEGRPPVAPTLLVNPHLFPPPRRGGGRRRGLERFGTSGTSGTTGTSFRY